MPHVELSLEECAVLRAVVGGRLHDLRREIHHTDHREFKVFLQRQEELLINLLVKLEQPLPAV